MNTPVRIVINIAIHVKKEGLSCIYMVSNEGVVNEAVLLVFPVVLFHRIENEANKGIVIIVNV